MMMALGMFVFELGTVPYQELNRQSDWRHAANNRLGRRPRRQFLGAGDDIITLSGEMRPEVTGGSLSLVPLRLMASTGKSWTLISGAGRIYGMYLIESIQEGNSEFFKDGTPRKINFSIKLARTDDNSIDDLGQLKISNNGKLP